MGCASRAGPKHDIMGPIHNTACIIRGLGRHDTKAQVVPGSAFRHDTNSIGHARHGTSPAWHGGPAAERVRRRTVGQETGAVGPTRRRRGEAGGRTGAVAQEAGVVWWQWHYGTAAGLHGGRRGDREGRQHGGGGRRGWRGHEGGRGDDVVWL